MMVILFARAIFIAGKRKIKLMSFNNCINYIIKYKIKEINRTLVLVWPNFMEFHFISFTPKALRAGDL